MLSKIMVITISVHGHVILLFIFQGLYNEDFFVKTKKEVQYFDIVLTNINEN